MDDNTVQSAPVPNQPMVPQQTAQSVMAPPQQPAAPAPVPPQQMQVQHNSRLGALAKSLLGKQYSYQVNPQTGQTVQTPVEQKPGELFRHLVAGALLGGAAEAEHPSNSGFLGGVSTGGAASMKADQQQDELKRSHVQEQFKNQQEVEKTGMERERLGMEKDRLHQEGIFQQAQVAQWTASTLRADKELEYQKQKDVEEQNQRQTMLQIELGKMHANPIVIRGKNGENVNGTSGNGKDILAFGADANNRPPDGFTWIPVTTTDYTGLHQDTKTNEWLDEKNTPVNINDRSKHTIYQAPLGQMAYPKGSELNKIAGTNLPPDKTYPMPFEDYVGLHTKEQDRALKQQADDRNDTKAQLSASYDSAKIARDTANDELRSATAIQDTAGMEAAKAKLDEATEEMQRVADLINPRAAKAREAAKKAKASGTPATANIPWSIAEPGRDYAVIKDGKPQGFITKEQVKKAQNSGFEVVPRPGLTSPVTPQQQKEAEELENSQPTP